MTRTQWQPTTLTVKDRKLIASTLRGEARSIGFSIASCRKAICQKTLATASAEWLAKYGDANREHIARLWVKASELNRLAELFDSYKQKTRKAAENGLTDQMARRQELLR